jgi:hypothetical protein
VACKQAYCLETAFRVADTCTIFAPKVFLLKGSGPMIFYLILDVMNGFWQLGDAHAENAITLLSTKVVQFNRPAGTANFLVTPGTSCLATMMLSRWDRIAPLGRRIIPNSP